MECEDGKYIRIASDIINFLEIQMKDAELDIETDSKANSQSPFKNHSYRRNWSVLGYIGLEGN